MLFYLQDQLTWSQQKQAHWANQNCQPQLKYKVEDIVYIDARHFVSEQDNKWLNMKNTRP